ncbi:MAG: hydroxymethylglutaryl-CoA synthase [Desulfobacterium sp.]|nr:hydroxymethylglutaryl-CoA synthase [Desulfobacterium sp.]MBU3948280.1 hydroxymethylglutaryl-CoA synthase [Pseudomonadota bacterium]MBU4010051.1 hydroxymethylglutaryl-CoA synthase [Pseudomonadota bacterium]MBU4036144.1 hydroxymethylglutaryl-CoA synthase [Pseudomonadota bacterium]
MAGIIGYGVTIPKKRISTKSIAKIWPGGGIAAGIKEKSVAAEDEDIVTLAVEASFNALKHAGLSASDIGALYLGTVSSQYIDKSSAILIAEAIGISCDVKIADFGGSVRAGSAAFLGCAGLIDSKKIKYGLAIGADCQAGEMGSQLETAYGAGAAAFILGADDVIAELGGCASQSTSLNTTWRVAGKDYVNFYDDARFHRTAGYFTHIKQAIGKCLAETNLKPEDISYLAVSQPDGKSPVDVAKSLKFKPEAASFTILSPMMGDVGSASSLIALAAALDNARPDEKILVASYGSGAGSDAFIVTAKEGINAKRGRITPVQNYFEENSKQYIEYIQYEKIKGRLKSQALPEPMSSVDSSPSLWRDKDFVFGLMALKCSKCGSINFPRRNICVEKDCRSRQFEKVPLPRCGVIETFFHQYVVYLDPEQAPFPMCIARLAGKQEEYGGKVTAMMVDSPMEDVKVGAKVELVLRRHGIENDIVKYGYKFRLIKEDKVGG